MSDPQRTLPLFTSGASRDEVMEVLHYFCGQSGYLVTVSEFSAYCPVPGKRTFLISLENDRDAASFAQAHHLNVFGYSGVLVPVD